MCTCYFEQEGWSEKVEVSNFGIAKKGPVIVEENKLMLEYTNGSVCQADGVMNHLQNSYPLCLLIWDSSESLLSF